MADIKGKRKRIVVIKKPGDPDRLVDFFNCFDDIYDLSCPVCFETIEDAQVTTCGHSFCSKCIYQSFASSKRCPSCSHYIDKVFPNFLLNDILMKKKKRLKSRKTITGQGTSKAFSEWKYLISMKASRLTREDIDILLATLMEKKKELNKNSKTVKDVLLQGFLKLSRKRRQDKLATLISELQIIESDAEELGQTLESHAKIPSSLSALTNKLTSADSEILLAPKDPSSSRVQPVSANSHALASSVTFGHSNLSIQSRTEPKYSSTFENQPLSVFDDPGKQPIKGKSSSESHLNDKSLETGLYDCTMSERWVKMEHHLEDLEDLYLTARVGQDHNKPSQYDLEDFKETLVRATACTTFKTLTTLSYVSDPTLETSIVSNLSFDKDNEIFAACGVTRLIKLYDFACVAQDSLISNYPIATLKCKSKVSCTSWSSYFKNSLASSEYEGSVTVWDVSTKQPAICFKEHKRRVWSVDFNKMDTNLISSGSDDGTVKLWSLNMESSIGTLKAPANICCVKFNPRSRYHLAFASADHCLYYYDLRNTREPEKIFKGHHKAVSCASFVSSDEVVTSSTDGQLKLWSISKNVCLKTYKGHVNDENFLGLASDGDYFCCGSENNAIYLYYKGFHKPIMMYSFESDEAFLPLQEKPRNVFISEFVGAITWKMDENILLAANSRGIIKVLELV